MQQKLLDGITSLDRIKFGMFISLKKCWLRKFIATTEKSFILKINFTSTQENYESVIFASFDGVKNRDKGMLFPLKLASTMY